FPEWTQQVADALRAAPAASPGGASASAVSSALDRLKADANPMTAVLDFSDALRDEPVERIVARLPELLRVKDPHELSAIVFLCLTGSRSE
ncbi:hypothetical protein LAN31_22785, partial [Mycobacterium tuberculosis]|nr:hypothetical protein [Mycobacterium tuberculosis]